MRHSRIAVPLLFFLFSLTVSARTQDSTLILVDSYAREVLKDWKIPGMALSIVKDDSLVFAKGFGVREKGRSVAKDGRSVAVTENTVFHIGSISKSFTAAVMASVVDEGLVSWDDTIKNIMPDFDWWDDEVEKSLQVKNLFTHSTGLVAQVGTYIPNLGYGREDIYRMLKYMEPWYGVGEKFAYNNITFIVAARIIEKVTGKSWEENMRERILIPLGMTASSLNEDGYKAAGKKAAVAHDFRYVPTKDGHGRMGVTPLYGEERALHWVTVIGPAGGVMSTAEDMSKWVRFHLDMGKIPSGNGDSIQLISRKNMEFLHTGAAFVKQDTTSVRRYGYCWYVEDNEKYHLIYHTGTTWGFTAICGFVPEIHLGFTLLCDSEVSEYARFSVMRRIIDLYFLKREREAYLTQTSLVSDGGCMDMVTVVEPEPEPEGYQAVLLKIILESLPPELLNSKAETEEDKILPEVVAEKDSTAIADRGLPQAPLNGEWPSYLRYSSLYDWNAHFLAKWWVDKKKPSRRSVPCMIKRSKSVPDFQSLAGTYHKEAPFGDARVTFENGKLYMTIGPKGWKHQLKHKSGNEFWMTSGGHTYPVFFHEDDFEIDFNYNENFGAWRRAR